MIHPAYLAGIIDGEGSIMVTPTGSGKIGGLQCSFSVKVQIANTDMRLLEAIRSSYGGKIEATGKSSERCRQGYRLRWFGAEAVNVINHARSHLLCKNRQADIACALYHMQQARKRRRITEEEAKTFNAMRDEVKRLNKRGVNQ